MIKEIDAEQCIGCGVCELICPADIIRMSQKTRKAVILYAKDCWTCFSCELECPVGAIEVDPIKRQQPNIWKRGQLRKGGSHENAG